VLHKTTKLALLMTAALSYAMAQDKPAEKAAKDEQEAALINSLPKEPDANKRLQTLQSWKEKYPETAFANERQQMFLETYQLTNHQREAIDTAVEILKRDPNYFDALRDILVDVPAMNGGKPSPADIDTCEKTANYILNNADTIFVPGKKPYYMSDADWGKIKEPMKLAAARIIPNLYVLRGDNERAEAEFVKYLKANPNDAAAAQDLGKLLLAQQKSNPKKAPIALFYYARAAAYTGPGSLPAQARQQLAAFVGRAYKGYHGSEEGLDKLMALAGSTPIAPADFTIKDAATIAQEEADKEEAARKANPMMALWGDLKTGLTGASPDSFFAEHVKDVGLPKFKGTLVSMSPATNPKELTLAVEKAGVADCVLKLEEGQVLRGKMEAGAELEFEGVGKDYKKDPYTLILEIDKAKITGWKPIAAPPPAKKAAPGKAPAKKG
jgi:hypothetical protein